MTTATSSAPPAAQLFHALSDPTRLGILERLRQGERCVCDLMDALDAAQSRLSFHLKVLKDAGLVSDRRDGRWIYYTLERAVLADASGYIDDLQAAARMSPRPGRRDCCD